MSEFQPTSRVLSDALPMSKVNSQMAREPLLPLELSLDEMEKLARDRGFDVQSRVLFDPDGVPTTFIRVPSEQYVLCLFPFLESDGRETVWVEQSKMIHLRKVFFDQQKGAVG